MKKKLSKMNLRKSPVIDRLKKRLEEKHWKTESMIIAMRILYKLDTEGMTQRDLAKKLDKSPQWVNKICQGKQNLTIGTIKELESVLGIPLINIPNVNEQSFITPDETGEIKYNLDENRSFDIFREADFEPVISGEEKKERRKSALYVNESNVGFRLVDISTEEFAVIEENFPKNKDDKVEISFSIGVKVNDEKHLIGIYTKYQFYFNEDPFLIAEVACHFMIQESDWDESMNEDNSITFNKDFLTHLLVLTVGTSRGVIHAKKPHELAGFILPTFDVTKVYKEDQTIDLSSDSESG